MWKTPQDIRDWMEDLDSSYRIQYSCTGSSTVATVLAQVVDNVTGKPWSEAEGIDEEDAVRNAFALALADTSKRPMSPKDKLERADTVFEENEKLKARLAALEAKTKATAPSKKVDKAEPAAV